MRKNRVVARIAATALGAAASPWAGAHGFVERYSLPVPLDLYLWAAGATVLLSFVVVAWFVRSGPGMARVPKVDLLRFAPVRRLASRPVVETLRGISVALFAMAIFAGLFGTRVPDRNLAPLLVWVFGWVGLAFVSALIGDVWRLVNPWKVTWEWAEALARRRNPEAGLSVRLPLPERVGVWPAVALFGGFAWMEIAMPTAVLPANTVNALLLYTAITWSGMALFGKDVWLQRGEAFTVAFGLLARFAPLEARAPSDPDGPALRLRPYGAGLLEPERVSNSFMAFALLLLATVTFDGFTATPAWVDLLVGTYRALPSVTLITTLGLIAFPLVFLAAYLITCGAMARAAGASSGAGALARRFVLTLVPIALAYHLAHYLTYLLVQAQALVPVASDPLGLGWDLFGTRDVMVDPTVVSAEFAWWAAILAIVGGHVVAVVLAHLEAQRAFGSDAAAVRSQLPMLVLMVGYTVLSLWILAQPIVEPAPAPAP